MGRPDVLVGTATASAWRGIESATGVVVSGSELTARVGWTAGLVCSMAEGMLTARFNEKSLSELAGGVSPDGRDLPTKAYMAMRRLEWSAPVPAGVVVSDRVRRMAEEMAGRALRLALHRRVILDAIISTWPANPKQRSSREWGALWEAMPAGVSKSEVRNRTRQVSDYYDEHGRLPEGLCEMETAPGVGCGAPLAVCDRQQVTVTRSSEGMATIEVLLAKLESPSGYSDWSWVKIAVVLPPTVVAEAELSSPTLRIVSGRVAVDLPWKLEGMPRRTRDGYERALGFDWGVSRLFTGTVGKLVYQDGAQKVVVDGRPLLFDPSGMVAKYHRLRKNHEKLQTKIRHLQALTAGKPDAKLETKLQHLLSESQAVLSRMSHLNHEIAWGAARWAIDQANALGAKVIYIEGLGSMEAGGKGRRLNARVSAQVRSQVFEAMRHLGSEHGIAVVEVPAENTSRDCPRCSKRLTHLLAPDRPEEGFRWAVCPHCHLSIDRDLAAAWRICARGLASQSRTLFRPNQTMFVPTKTYTDLNVTAAKRSQRDKKQATKKSPRPMPRRRRVPSPVHAGTGKRPEGVDPQASSNGQATQTSSQVIARCPHHPRGEPLGRGFHLNVYASPVRPYGDWGPQTGTPKT